MTRHHAAHPSTIWNFAMPPATITTRAKGREDDGWDPYRTETFEPYIRADTGEVVLARWDEAAGAGHTRREVVVDIADAPRLIALLAQGSIRADDSWPPFAQAQIDQRDDDRRRAADRALREATTPAAGA